MTKISRRSILGQTAAAGLVSVLSKGGSGSQSPKGIIKKGRLKQSVSRWPYSKIAFPEFCRAVSEIGLTAIDLLSEEEWPIAREYGLICSMAWAPKEIKIDTGLNVKANHDTIIRTLERLIPSAAKSNVPNVIAFFGNRRGISDAEGKENCTVGLNRIRKVAEDHGVNVCVELLNSKINHKDYQGDHTAFGVEIVKAVDSARIKLLYDIYHMQIMEGDVIRTIRDNHQWIGHYHTGGVPGRHELDDDQELNWRGVCKAIAETGYKGYVAHEFIPTRDPITSLREAVALCDV